MQFQETNRQSSTKLDLIIPLQITKYIQRLITITGNSDENSIIARTLIMLMLLRSEFYKISGKDPINLTPENVIAHINCILDNYFSNKELGYILPSTIKDNPVISVILQYHRERTGSSVLTSKFKTSSSWGPKDNEVMKESKSGKPLVISQSPISEFEITHVNNLVIMMLILEILMVLKSDVMGVEDEVRDDLDLLYQKLFGLLTAGLRKTIGQSRLSIEERIYTGFDTEFRGLDYGENNLLCCTTAIYSRLILRVKGLKPSYQIKNAPANLDRKPLLYREIESLIGLFRDFLGKDDLGIFQLQNDLQTYDELIRVNEGIDELYHFGKTFELENILTDIFDFRQSPKNYSLDFLATHSLKRTELDRNSEINRLLEIMTKSGYNVSRTNKLVRLLDETGALKYRVVIRQNLYLICHFSVADVCSWSDFEDLKTKFRIIGKSYVTTGLPYKHNGLNVYLRDTMLISPAGASLKSIGSLYESSGLSKLEIEKSDRDSMDLFMETNYEVFKEYAIKDSVIALYHALTVEQSSVQELGKFSIPITLSSFSNQYCNARLDDNRYPLPTGDGRYNIGNTPALFTPVGVELSAGLSTIYPLILGSYHGGRNESFMYGKVPGPVYDYDLPGAYPTALSLLTYPDYNKGFWVYEQKGSEFIKWYLDKYRVDIVHSFGSFWVKFKFPEGVKYPNLPVRLDHTSLIYPSEGISNCTGVEIFLAVSLGAEVDIIMGYVYPWSIKDITAPAPVDKELELIKLWRDDARLKRRVSFTKEEIINGMLIISYELKISMYSSHGRGIPDILKHRFELAVKESREILCDDCCYQIGQYLGLDLVFPELNRFKRIEHNIVPSSQTYFNGSTSGLGLELEAVIDGVSSLTEELLENLNDVPYENESVAEVQESDIKNDKNESDFFKVVKLLVSERLKHKKGTFGNGLYKFIANAMIGQMARGISNKMALNTELGINQPVPAGKLTNPLYAAWVTAFVRSTVTELMNYVHKVGGFVVSVTTDGFITNIENLWEKADGYFVGLYKAARLDLTGNSLLLEQKWVDEKGVLSWSTRGQLGLGSGLKAATGYQIREGLDTLRSELLTCFDGSKRLRFMQFSLRSASEIYKVGGVVTPKISEREFSMSFDNRRCLVPSSPGFEYLDSKPHKTMGDCKLARLFAGLSKIKFDASVPIPNLSGGGGGGSGSVKFERVLLRMLIRLIYQYPEYFGFNPVHQIVKRSEVKEVINGLGILGFSTAKVSDNYISRQKSVPFLKNSIPKTPRTVEITKVIENKYPLIRQEFLLAK